MSDEPNQIRRDLRNLLGYAEEILKAGERIVADLSKDAMAAVMLPLTTGPLIVVDQDVTRAVNFGRSR
jgi:hypothetical protein